jgi:uncharacterized protein YaaQ
VLLLAIVQAQDVDEATRALVGAGLGVTRISSFGGFLGAKNSTLLIGLDEARVSEAMALLAQTCRTRTAYVSAPLLGGSMPSIAEPLEVEVGGATLFVLVIERMLRLGSGPAELHRSAPESPARMQLIVAVTSTEVAPRVLQTLSEAQFRATLISTTGGFLRQGNSTLLIGVDARRVDDVLQRIAKACATASGRASRATLFVLDVQTYLRV